VSEANNGPRQPGGGAVEQQLIARSQAGDRAAFEEIVRRCARLLYCKLYLETGDSHRAEDLVQETLLVAWRSIRQVTDPGGFRPWLFSIAHSVLVDSCRREGRKKRAGPRVGIEALAAVSDTRPTPPEKLQQDEDQRRVLGVLRSMPEEYRLPLMLRYLAGADYETISQQLGLSNGSLRGLLNRGMTRLREKMGMIATEVEEGTKVRRHEGTKGRHEGT
jgi:RNA polymerase sigma-70 factor (ECF subfamily)